MLYWMDIEDDITCYYDSLSLYDGGWFTPELGELMAKLCGSSVGDAYVTTKRRATLVFTSDYSVRHTGFELDYRFYKKGKILLSNFKPKSNC